jgi:hypothetical protein
MASLRNRTPSPKRRVITLAKKYEVVMEVERGLKPSEVARKFDLPTSTLHTILKSKIQIKSDFQSNKNPSNSKVRVSPFANLEEFLIEWILDLRERNVPVNGLVIRNKAKEVGPRFGFESFVASDGWFNRFKQRHNLIFKIVCGEEGAVARDPVNQWKNETLPEILKKYEPHNVFNADESGLFFRALPNKTFNLRGQKCTGGKQSKVRLTIMTCANEDGSQRLPLLVIGKSAKPRCFKNVKKLPVEYTANKKAWMTSR